MSSTRGPTPPPASVGTTQLVDGAVTATKLVDRSITADRLAEGSLLQPRGQLNPADDVYGSTSARTRLVVVGFSCSTTLGGATLGGFDTLELIYADSDGLNPVTVDSSGSYVVRREVAEDFHGNAKLVGVVPAGKKWKWRSVQLTDATMSVRKASEYDLP